MLRDIALVWALSTAVLLVALTLVKCVQGLLALRPRRARSIEVESGRETRSAA